MPPKIKPERSGVMWRSTVKYVGIQSATPPMANVIAVIAAVLRT